MITRTNNKYLHIPGTEPKSYCFKRKTQCKAIALWKAAHRKIWDQSRATELQLNARSRLIKFSPAPFQRFKKLQRKHRNLNCIFSLLPIGIGRPCENIAFLIASSTVQAKEIAVVRSLPYVLPSRTRLVPMSRYHPGGWVVAISSCSILSTGGQLEWQEPLASEWDSGRRSGLLLAH